jgi:hypothetical protein
MQGCLCDSAWPVGYGEGETQLAEYFGADCSLSKWESCFCCLALCLRCSWDALCCSLLRTSTLPSFVANTAQLSFSHANAICTGRCPSGDDPYTTVDETNCQGITQAPGMHACALYSYYITPVKCTPDNASVVVAGVVSGCFHYRPPRRPPAQFVLIISLYVLSLRRHR